MEFIFISDNHFGKLKKLFPNKPWIEWSLRPLEQARKYALDHGINFIFHGADFWDSFPTQEMEAAASNFFKQDNDTGIQWHMIGGNHGVRSMEDHSLVKLRSEVESGWIKNLNLYLEPKRFKLNGIQFIMLPWPLTSSDLLNTKRSIVIAHEEQAGFKNDNGTDIKGKAFDLKGHFWFIGHLHGFQRKGDTAFVGSTSQFSFGEGKDHYFFHVKVGKNVEPKIKKVLIHNPYTLTSIRIDTEKDWSKLESIKEDEYVRIVRNAAVAIPDGIMNNPKILKEAVYGNRQDLEAIKRDAVNIEHVGVSTKSRLSLMKKSLSNSTLNKDQKKQALKIFKKGIEEIRFNQTGIR